MTHLPHVFVAVVSEVQFVCCDDFIAPVVIIIRICLEISDIQALIEVDLVTCSPYRWSSFQLNQLYSEFWYICHIKMNLISVNFIYSCVFSHKKPSPGKGQPRISTLIQILPLVNQERGLTRMYRATTGTGKMFRTGISFSLLPLKIYWGKHIQPDGETKTKSPYVQHVFLAEHAVNVLSEACRTSSNTKEDWLLIWTPCSILKGKQHRLADKRWMSGWVERL